MDAKKTAADEAVKYVSDGMTLGLGTGSTAYWAIEGIAERMKKEGLKLRAIATSKRSDEQARELGIPMVGFDMIDRIDLTIDGADEVDPQLNLIKGGGGALLREKIVAYNSRRLVIVADDHKLVPALGQFPLPVETIIFGWEKTVQHLEKLGCQAVLRKKDNQIFLSDNGHYILDCHFEKIADPQALGNEIKKIPGVVEHGLFIGLAARIVVGSSNGQTKILDKKS